MKKVLRDRIKAKRLSQKRRSTYKMDNSGCDHYRLDKEFNTKRKWSNIFKVIISATIAL